MKRFYLFVLVLAYCLFGSSIARAQGESGPGFRERIIRAEQYQEPQHESGDIRPSIQLTAIFIGQREVFLNVPFFADDNWVKELRVRVKNMGDHTVTCVAISFGLLNGMDTKLKAHESWPWGLSLKRGDCHALGSRVKNRHLELRPGQEIDLGHTDILPIYVSHLGRMGQLSKAVLHRDAEVRMQNHQIVESAILLPAKTRFLDEEPY